MTPRHLKYPRDKRVARIARLLEAIGFTRCPRTRNAHLKYRHPTYGCMFLPQTPSDHRWLANQLAKVSRKTGIPKARLERMLPR